MPWHNQNTYGFLRTSQEAQDNAEMIYNALYALGWKCAAICAMLGNVEAESNYNPWRWQSEQILADNDSRIGIVCGGNTAHAYGLCQSDPAANYIYRPVSQSAAGYGPNYSNNPGSQDDGNAQMIYLNWICENDNGSCGGWNPNYLSSIPFATFKVQEDETNYTIDQLTKIFHDGYERSNTWSSTGTTRQAAAHYWYTYFQGYVPPTPPPPPPPTPIPVWEMFLFLKRDGRHGIIDPKNINRKKVIF